MIHHFHWAASAYMLLETAEGLGVPRQRVLEAAGLEPVDLPPAPGRMRWRPLRALTQAALELTGEPALGLLSGFRVNPEHAGVAGHYEMHTSPIRESQRVAYEEVFPRITTLLRFWHEARDGLGFNCTESLLPGDPLVRPHVQLMLGVHVALMRILLGSAAVVDHVSIRDTDAGSEAKLSQMMGCRVAAGQARDWLAVPSEVLSAHMPLSDPWLRRQLRPQLDAFLRLLDEDRQITLATRNHMDTMLLEGRAIELKSVAAVVRMKPRTLQARLAAEGTTFSAEVSTVRKEFALRMLGVPGNKLSAVAAQAGFSDPAAFTRAFKRWTGLTPTAWQEGKDGGIPQGSMNRT